jgi:hypothetical protein
MFISIPYMFLAAMCPSSGELYQYNSWYMSLCIDNSLVCRFGRDFSGIFDSILLLTVIYLFKVRGSVHLQSLEQNNQLDATINRKTLLTCRTDTAQRVLGIAMPITVSPLTNRPRLRTLPPAHSY